MLKPCSASDTKHVKNDEFGESITIPHISHPVVNGKG